MITVGSLFSGVGGIELGLERTGGFETVWQVEKSDSCQDTLTKQWPAVAKYREVEDVGEHNLRPVDLICGGFPCPAVSQAARGRNNGRWLWPEFARVVSGLGPRYVLVENVDALRYRGRGMGRVLGDLAKMGYDAEWRVFPASWAGAPHKRARVWLVAYPNGYSKPDSSLNAEAPLLSEPDRAHRDWPDPPSVLSVDDGFSDRMALQEYGNAVVPQVAEFIGRQLLRAHAGDQV